MAEMSGASPTFGGVVVGAKQLLFGLYSIDVGVRLVGAPITPRTIPPSSASSYHNNQSDNNNNDDAKTVVVVQTGRMSVVRVGAEL